MLKPPEEQLAYLGFHRIAPNPLLQPYIRSYWYFYRETTLATHTEEFMHPSGGFGIVFNFGDPLTLDQQHLDKAIFLDGVNTLSRKLGFTGRIELMGIRFYAGGAYPFLDIPLHNLQNEVALLDMIAPQPLIELYARLHEVDQFSTRIKILEQWLLRCLAHGKKRNAIIPASLARLRMGQLSVPDLANEFAVSQRQLERLYQSQVGVSPQRYLQLQRVERARLALKQNPNQSNAHLAVALGFYDQPHFIREFKAVVGMTPYQYMKRK